MTVTDWGVSSSVKLGDSFRIDGGRSPCADFRRFSTVQGLDGWLGAG